MTKVEGFNYPDYITGAAVRGTDKWPVYDKEPAHCHRWRRYLWEQPDRKYRGVNMSQALAIMEKEPDMYAVFCALERIKR